MVLGLASLTLGVASKVLLKKEAQAGRNPAAVALTFAAAAAPVAAPVGLWWAGGPGAPGVAAFPAAPALPSVWAAGAGWCAANLAGALFRQRAYAVAPMGAVGVFTTTAGAVAGAALLLARGEGDPRLAALSLALVAAMAGSLLPREGRRWAADAVLAWAAYGLAAGLAGWGGRPAVAAGNLAALAVWLALRGWRWGGLTARVAAAGVLEGLAWMAYAQALTLAPLVGGTMNALQGLAVVSGARAALGERVTVRLGVAAALGLGAVAAALRAG